MLYFFMNDYLYKIAQSYFYDRILSDSKELDYFEKELSERENILEDEINNFTLDIKDLVKSPKKKKGKVFSIF